MSKNVFIGSLFDDEEEEDFDGKSFLPCTVDEFRAAQEDTEYDGSATALANFESRNELSPEVVEATRNADVVVFGKSDKLGIEWVECGYIVEQDDDDVADANEDDPEYEFTSYIFAPVA
jgi:hypothetical protein